MFKSGTAGTPELRETASGCSNDAILMDSELTPREADVLPNRGQPTSNLGSFPAPPFLIPNSELIPHYWRPPGAVTHRHQRVVHGLLLRMSLEPLPLPSAGSSFLIPHS
jgi:hypothetical protein